MKTLSKIVNKTTWWLFGTLCVLIGLYPGIYFLIDRRFGLLSSKTVELLSDNLWNMAFYGHIVLGGVALLVGWTQFSSSFRERRMTLHRSLGMLYFLSVLVSGSCGIFIAQYATGGITNVIGFSLSAVIWIATTVLAFMAIRERNIEKHQDYMTYSYSVCFSAVTLRIWLPLLTSIYGAFEPAYLIVGWLSWVPNLIVAYWIIRMRKNRNES